MSLLLGLSALIAALVMIWRYRAQRRHERLRPGASTDTAIPIHDYSQIDASIDAQRCACGGGLTTLGEGPVASGAPIRFCRLECRECGRESTIYFDLGSMEKETLH